MEGVGGLEVVVFRQWFQRRHGCIGIALRGSRPGFHEGADQQMQRPVRNIRKLCAGLSPFSLFHLSQVQDIAAALFDQACRDIRSLIKLALQRQ